MSLWLLAACDRDPGSTQALRDPLATGDAPATVPDPTDTADDPAATDPPTGEDAALAEPDSGLTDAAEVPWWDDPDAGDTDAAEVGTAELPVVADVASNVPPPECTSALDCAAATSPCVTPWCTLQGKCGVLPANDGAPCPGDGCVGPATCQAGKCIGPPLFFQQTYTSTSKDDVRALAVLPGQGFVLAGTRLEPQGNRDFLLRRAGLSGQPQWEQTFDFAPDERLHGVVADAGGFLLAGKALRSAGHWDGQIVRANPQGQLLWHAFIGGPGQERFYAVAAVPTGGWLLAGSAKTSGSHVQAWAVRVDEAGAQIASQTYGGASDERALAAVVLEDGGWLLAGEVTATGAACDGWVVRTDAAGKELWTSTWATPGWNRFTAAVRMPGGDVALGGTKRVKHQDAWAVRLTPAGATVWDEVQEFSSLGDRVTSLAVSAAGQVVAAVVSSEDPDDDLGVATRLWYPGTNDQKWLQEDVVLALAIQGPALVRASVDGGQVGLRREAMLDVDLACTYSGYLVKCDTDTTPCTQAWQVELPETCTVDTSLTEGLPCGADKTCQSGACK